MEILKSAEDSLDLFRDLLDEICKKFPAQDSSQDGTFLRVSCTWGSSVVSVSPEGFLFLEAAEDAMQSTEQNLELVVVHKILSGHLLSALASRLGRQQPGKDVIVQCSGIQCEDKDSASAIFYLMQHCRKLNFCHLLVKEDIGREGWAALREASSWRAIPHLDTCLKINMASARMEDLRAIWECLSFSWKSSGDQMKFQKQRGEKGWKALERFLDFTDEEWRLRTRKRATIGLEPHVHPIDNLGIGPVVLYLGDTQLEMQMVEPGRQGFRDALQHVQLFHPAFGPEPELHQDEDVQDDVGQAGQLQDEAQGLGNHWFKYRF